MINEHEKYAPLLDAFIDAELSEEQMAEVGFHVAECPECQKYVQDAAKIREAFPDLEDIIVPEGFAESVMASLPAWRGAERFMENNNNFDNLNNTRVNPAVSGGATPENPAGGANNQTGNLNQAGTPENAAVNANQTGTPVNQAGSLNQTGTPENNMGGANNNNRTWRNIALGLAACLVVVVAVQVSGVLNPDRGAATDTVGAAVAGAGAENPEAEGVQEESQEEKIVSQDTDAADTEESAENPEANPEEETAETESVTETDADQENAENAAPEDESVSAETVEAAEDAAAKASQDDDADTRNADAGETEAENIFPDAGELGSVISEFVNSALAGAENNADAGDNGGDTDAGENHTAAAPAYDAALTLPSDAAPFFSLFEPVATDASGAWYELSHDDYAAILEQLDGAGFVGNDIRIPRTDTVYILVES